MKKVRKVVLAIKVNGEIFYPQKPGVQHPLRHEGCFKPVCIIKKLPFGFWCIDYFDDFMSSHKRFKYMFDGIENIPNTRIIASPFFVEFVKYGFLEYEPD